MRGSLALAVSCIAAMNCSSTAAETPKTECAGCTADAAPPAPQGSASLHLVAADGAACAPGPRWMNVPIGDIALPTVTGSMRGERAVDGQNGAAVTCTVILIGGGYAMSADLEVARGDRFIHLTTSALVNPKTSAPQPIEIHVEDEAVNPLRQGDCSLVPGVDGEDWSVAMAPGRFWGKIVCPGLLFAASDAGASGCAIDEGYLELAHCP
jgi:hypothetical protein